MAVFFYASPVKLAKWALASIALIDVYTDFTLSRHAMNCTSATLESDKHTVGTILSWLEEQILTDLAAVTARFCLWALV